MELRVFNDAGEHVRTIDINSTSFLVVSNGETGLVCDKDNLRYLKLEDKRVIKQDYVEIVRRLVNAYSQLLYKIEPDSIVFVVNEAWEPSEKASKKTLQKINIKKAPAWLADFGDFSYMIEVAQHWLEKWSEAQLHAAIMSQLLRINPDESKPLGYSEDFQSKLVATFGIGYLEPTTVIPDLLKDDVKLVGFREASGQMHMDELPENGEDETDGDVA